VQLNGGGNSSGGVLNVAGGAVFDLAGSSTNVQTLTGTYTGGGGGTVLFSQGTIQVGTGSGLIFNFPANMFQWQGGTITSAGRRDLSNLGFITLSGSSTATFTGALDNSGNITQIGAITLRLTNGNLNNQFNGTVDFQGTNGIVVTGASSINNAGIIKKSADAGTITLAPVVNNPGSLEVDAGTLRITGVVTQIVAGALTAGVWTVKNGATLTIASSGNLATNNAIVSVQGAGAAFTNFNNLATNGGTFSLLDGAVLSPTGNFTNNGTFTLGVGSTLTIGGTYTQGGAGVLNVQIGGPPDSGQFGQLSSGGTANLAGTFGVSLANGFAPAPGDDFQVLTFASKNGDFTTTNGLQPGRNRAFTALYVPSDAPTSLHLVARQVVFHSNVQEIFVIGLDNQVYAQKLNADGTPNGDFFLTATDRRHAVKALSIGKDASNNTELFVIGLDDQVYAQKFDANGDPVGTYFLTRASRVKFMTVGRDGNNNPLLFVIGLDDQVYAQKFDANGNSASNYFLTKPGAIKTLAVGNDASGNPELFVIGMDNQVYAQKFDANGNSASNYFLTKGGAVKAISVGFDINQRPELFVIGMDDQVYGQKFDANGNSISDYFLTQAGKVKSLLAGHDGNNNPEVFVLGLDDQVYAQKFDVNGSSASSYFLTKPGAVKSLTLGYDANNDPELFVLGLNDEVYGQRFDVDGNSISDYFNTSPGSKVQTIRLTP
jgi:hypothetical protein